MFIDAHCTTHGCTNQLSTFYAPNGKTPTICLFCQRGSTTKAEFQRLPAYPTCCACGSRLNDLRFPVCNGGKCNGGK